LTIELFVFFKSEVMTYGKNLLKKYLNVYFFIPKTDVYNFLAQVLLVFLCEIFFHS